MECFSIYIQSSRNQKSQHYLRCSSVTVIEQDELSILEEQQVIKSHQDDKKPENGVIDMHLRRGWL